MCDPRSRYKSLHGPDKLLNVSPDRSLFGPDKSFHFGPEKSSGVDKS